MIGEGRRCTVELTIDQIEEIIEPASSPRLPGARAKNFSVVFG